MFLSNVEKYEYFKFNKRNKPFHPQAPKIQNQMHIVAETF